MSEQAISVAEVRLYQLTDRLQAVQEALMENGGELTPALEMELDLVEGAVEEKVERTLHLIRQMEATAAARKAALDQYDGERNRLRALVKAGEASAKGLKEYLIHELRRQGREEIETATFKAKIRRASRPKIEWAREVSELPEEYRRVTVDADTNKAWDDLRKAPEGEEALPDGFKVEYSEWLDVR